MHVSLKWSTIFCCRGTHFYEETSEMKPLFYPFKIACIWCITVHEVKEVNGFMYTRGLC